MIEPSDPAMPEKKKMGGVTKASNTAKGMTKSQVSKSRIPEPQSKTAEPQAISSGPKQLAAFESAVKLFHARRFKEARDMFQKAAEGPERDVAHRARLHVAMCERRLGEQSVPLRSAEDYYNYGVALLNSRRVGEARDHLEKALAMAPGTDHIHYALALAQALSGDIVGALDNLARAIEIEPRNRLIARQDADFAPVANQPQFQALLHPEKKTW